MMIFTNTNFSSVHIPELTVQDEVFQRCRIYGQRTALIDGATGRSYTYAQVEPLSRRCAYGLRKIGLKKGQLVAIILPNMPEYALCLFGILAAGGTATTINPSYTANEMNKQLVDSEATILITAKGLEKTVQASVEKGGTSIKHKVLIGPSDTKGFLSFKDLLANEGAPIDLTFDVKVDPAVIPYSSGTTGLPKGVVLTHYNLMACQYQLGHESFVSPEFPRFHERLHETSLCIIPMFHAYGLTILIIGALRIGHTVVSLPRFEPELFLSTIEKYKVSILNIVPPLVVFMAKSPLVKKYDLSSIKRVASGAAPLSAEVTEEFLRRVKVKNLTQGYGMTETSPTITTSLPNKVCDGSSGIIVPGTQVKIVDLSTGKALGRGQRGEIWVKGPQVMKGYLKNPKATAETIDKEGWLHTGDVGYFNEEDHIFIVDRIKELIKYKAFQVAPAELEALLLTLKGIADAAVVGIPDADAGEVPRAYVVLKEGATNITVDDILNYVKENAAHYKQLRGGVAIVKAIPKNPSGKILRKDLVNEYMKSKL